MSEKPSGDELEKLLFEFAQEEEWNGLHLLSEAEREAKLAASGIDRKRAREMGEKAFDAAIAAEAEAQAKAAPAVTREASPAPEAGPAEVIDFEARRTERAGSFLARWATPLSIAAGVVLLIGVVWSSGVFDPADDPRVTSPYQPTAEEQLRAANHAKARRLLDDASQDAIAKRWKECLAKLDEAEALEPELGRDPAVQDLRKAIEATVASDAGSAGDAMGADATR
jgi:hypothetical protein